MNKPIKIIAPNSFEEEKKYIIDVIFKEFLGLSYELVFESTKTYSINLPNKNKITFKDDFFRHLNDTTSYLKVENIPKSVLFAKNDFLVEKNIPIIFGDNTMSVSEQEINSGIDVFASSFFMLTRWEEYVNKARDNHERFSAHDSLAFKNNFLDRPIVNEYIEMVWKMLMKMGCDEKRKEYRFKWLITHDIDFIKKWSGAKKILRTFAGDILLRKNLTQAFRSFKSWLFTLLNLSKDPFDKYNILMDVSEEVGTKSHFFFMAGGDTKYDNEYDVKMAKDIIYTIHKRGHYIGFHPSYNSYNDPSMFSNEKAKLEHVIGQSIETGRQHFLRCELPHTLQIWNDMGMSWDCTLGYADEPGFRCGVCYEFPYFNFLTKKKLVIKEKPLILMDTTLVNYKNYSAKKTLETINYYKKTVKKYDGEFVFLWHNSSFDLPPYDGYEKIYPVFFKQ